MSTTPNKDGPAVAPQGGMTPEDKSKDEFFVKLAMVAEAMIKAHGKDFAMGVMILSARFIAEGKPLIKPNSESVGEWVRAAEPKQ